LSFQACLCTSQIRCHQTLHQSPHRNTGIAAAGFVKDSALGEFEWMRQVRNATEYPDDDRPTATSQDVAEAIDAAIRIVDVCAEYVRRDE
ncbi:hypothetical protein, partial [Brevibacterium picturae]|uniref:hypothetical protein n=1 Tax=Brevibacterium picturae TaxID=260553 RepID=UPI0031F80D8E